MATKDIYDFDPLSPAQAAFRSLTRDTKIHPVAGGASFAIGGQGMPFAWLSYATKLSQAWGQDAPTLLNGAKSAYGMMRPSTEEGRVYHPTREAAIVAGLTPATLVAGLAHEAGHYICDLAGVVVPLPELDRFDHLVEKIVDRHGVGALGGLHRHVNLFADIRLERRLGARYPNLRGRFTALQHWVNKLEAKTREAGDPASMLMLTLRDLGKGWLTAVELERLYGKQWIDFIQKLAGELLPPLIETDSSDEDSAHTPVEAALKWLLAIGGGSDEPPPDGPDGKGKKGKGKKGKGKKGGGEGDDQGGGEGDDGEGENEGDDQGGGEGDDGEGENEGDDQGGGEGENEGEDEGDTPPPNPPPKGGLPEGDVEKVLKGAFVAHDPSSAMEQAMREGAKNIDHKVWVDGSTPLKRLNPNSVFR